jgi:hypothetical protein
MSWEIESIARVRLLFLVTAAILVAGTATAQQSNSPHAHRNVLGIWECDRGYRSAGTACVAVEIPTNAHLDVFGNDWECNKGYRPSGGSCVPVAIPANAHLDVFGHDWECNRGFRLTGSSCVVLTVPPHAHVDVFGHAWECDANYRIEGQECVAMTAQEAATTRAAAQAAIQRIIQERRALSVVDWSSCNDDMDRLRRRSADAADKAEEVESAKDDYDRCRRNADEIDSCRGRRSSYESLLDEFRSLLDDVQSGYRSAMNSCGF